MYESEEAREMIEKIEPASPFIDTRRGEVHVQEGVEVVVSLRIRGTQ